MLKQNTIINFVSAHEGITTFDFVSKFSKKYQIRPESVKNHLYRLKKIDFLEEKNKKLYSKNPFDEIFLKFLYSKDDYEKYLNLSKFSDSILEVLGAISPHAHLKIQELLLDSLSKTYKGLK